MRLDTKESNTIDYSYLKDHIILGLCDRVYTDRESIINGVGILSPSSYVTNLDSIPSVKWSFEAIRRFTIGNRWDLYSSPQEAIDDWLTHKGLVYAFDDMIEALEFIKTLFKL